MLRRLLPERGARLKRKSCFYPPLFVRRFDLCAVLAVRDVTPCNEATCALFRSQKWGGELVRKILTVWAVAFFMATTARGSDDAAALFGARESIADISLSPDGQHVAYIQPVRGRESVLFIASLSGGEPKAIMRSDADPWTMQWCGWASNSRLVCESYALIDNGEGLIPFTRFLALNIDGSNVKQLGQRTNRGLRMRQFDGDIIGWSANDNGHLIMSRAYVAEGDTGTRIASKAEGLGVDFIDTASLKTDRLIQPRPDAAGYIADNAGRVRILMTADRTSVGQLKGSSRYYYRAKNSDEWKAFSRVTQENDALMPVAVDSERDVAYAYKDKDGRSALYAVKLDGTMSEELLLANDKVDIDRLVRFGRSGRVIGAQFVTDRRETKLFDAEYRSLSSRLSKALPGLPLISMIDASRDETKILLFAGGDTDPGRYFVYDKTGGRLAEIALARPELESKKLSSVKLINYPAADGTQIPAYLTLPPDGDGKNLPAIVMPHGGPAARDEWGFDWLAQYFASIGYAVLQPNFRGSSGYGDDWYAENGFKSWRLAVGDINDAGGWLVAQGIADADRMGIVGWSYGGYAALQSGVIDPDRFKAVVAIAPVTDLKLLAGQSRDFTNSELVTDFIGTGEHIVSGSPLQQIDRLKAPVLMFSGDKDLNVWIIHSRQMESAMKKKAKDATLVIYPGLDHQINDSAARKDMLQRSADFLAKHLSAK